MKQQGFTLIEMMIVVVILGIVLSLIAGVAGTVSGDSSVSLGVNGVTESRCIEGYKFVIDQTGNSRQILNESGKGVPCGNPDPGKIGSFGSR